MVLEKKRRNSFTSTAGKKVDIAKAETTTRAQLLAKKKNLRVGDVCNLKITALATNNIGIDEYSFPYAVFVPNAKIGTKIQAKILKIKDASYAVAQLLTLGGEEKTNLLVGTVNKDEKLSNPSLREGGKVEAPVKPGEVLTVSIKKQMENGKAGIVEYANNFRLIIPFVGTNINTETKQLDNVKVTVTRVKENYGFAKMETSFSYGINQRAVAFPTGGQESGYVRKTNDSSLEVGSKLTTTLRSSCLKSFTKGNGKFVVLNLASLSVDSSFSSLSKEVKEEKKPMVLFLKLKKGGSYYQKLVMNGELRVRIKITSKSSNCVVGKILQINPISKAQKTSLVLNSIGEMISHGMHFGEKVVKCNARMKNYIWSTGLQSNASTTSASLAADKNGKANVGYSKGETKQGLKKPLIKKGRHVINLLKTRRCLNQALKKVTKYALKGRTFLFIGTKKPAAGLVARASFFTKNSFYVNTRWLGGMLTNWKTICKSISKIRPILKEKQKVVRQILERRQAIKNRLIKKALLLRKKSKLILSKGRLLLETLSSPSLHEGKQQAGTETREKLSLLRVASDEFINKGMQYVERRQKLIQKRRDLIYQTVLLKEKAFELGLKHKAILNQLAIYAKKLREYKYLLILTTEIQKMRSLPSTIEQKEGIHMNLLSVSYGKLKELNLLLKKGKEVAPTGDNDLQNFTETKAKLSYGEDWIIPNPPKEILNRIVICASKAMKTQTVSPTGGTSSLISDKSTSGAANPSSPETNRQEATNGQFIVCSTLLSKFSGFSSYIKSVMKSLMISIQSLETQAKLYSTQLNQIQATLQTYINLKQTYVNELEQLKLKFIKERSMVRIVKRKLKALEAQKKLLKFLPRLRYLPTPQTKISEIVQILLARIVDPKLKYPIENIYNQKLSMSSKKEAAARKKKWQRLEKYFGGIANMTKLNKTQMSRNIAIIIGQKEEMNAVRECQKLGIKMFTVVDTNCNPTFSDHIIPANDDSRSSIKYILTKFITRIRLAQKLRSRLSSYTAK